MPHPSDWVVLRPALTPREGDVVWRYQLSQFFRDQKYLARSLGKIALYVLWCLILKVRVGSELNRASYQNAEWKRTPEKESSVGPVGQTLLTQESQPENKALYSIFKRSLRGEAVFLPHS